MMSPSGSTKPRRSRTNGQGPPKILVEPTFETQVIYNQIREDEVRHQKQHCLQNHVTSEDRLCPPEPRTPRSVTNESHISGSSLSPASTTDIPAIEISPTTGKRPRGRRAGPLATEKRYKTAIKRKLGLVCEHCKVKKVVCDHYDLSKFEDAYQAPRRTPQTDSRGFSPAQADLFGLEDNRTLPPDLPADEDLASDFNATSPEPNSRQQDLHNLVNSFDVSSVSLGTGTLQVSFGRSYNPGLYTSVQVPRNLSNPVAVGIEWVASTAVHENL
ncbi:hypothetical protein SUNI508_13832 [Seiridium unicorne]|uniref:Zn(2)-C6 fungal-type domain-containing protein n=1 Tax=Seiridium unicorne TaxID=138068 RepID=A0ABR2VB72_9PEZI